MRAVPVIALTGYLGAGKTTVLNHVLRTPGARIGVVINDFGELNVDAGLVSGQVDEPASIAGGCICCLSDDDALDVALAKLADPKLDLDVIIVEASGLADPISISRIIRFSGADNVRWGGVVDVIDAAEHFATVDRGGVPPGRYAAASLIVVNKLDLAADADGAAALARIEQRIRQGNADAHMVGVVSGRLDPALLFDVPVRAEASGQLSFQELLQEPAHAHNHADSVTRTSTGCVDPNALFDLLEDPPSGVYRLKGVVAIRYRSAVRRYVVNLVGASVHVAAAPADAATIAENHLVAIGMHLDIDGVRERLNTALRSAPETTPASGIRRLQRYRRLSV
jgi:G3E family GTPase